MITISQRLRAVTNVGEDGYEGISKLSKEFKNIANIDIFDQETGQLRDTYSILQDMARIFPTLTKNQRQYLAEMAAGKRQINVLESLLSNWQGVERAAKAASNSTGSAEKENSKYLNSIEGKTKAVESAMQKLASATVDDSLIKWFLDIEKVVVDATTSVGGLIPIILLLITAFSSKLVPVLGVVINAFKQTKDAMVGAEIAAKGLSATGVFAAISLGLTIISTAVGLWNNYKNKLKEVREENVRTSQSNIEELQNLKTSYNQVMTSTDSQTLKNSKLSDSLDTLKTKYGLTSAELAGYNENLAIGNKILDERLEKEYADKWVNIAEEYKKAYKNIIESTSDSGSTEFSFIGNEDAISKDFEWLSEKVGELDGIKMTFEKIGVGLDGKSIFGDIAFDDNVGLEDRVELLKELIGKYELRNDLSVDEEGILASLRDRLNEYNSVLNDSKNAYDSGANALANYMLAQNSEELALIDTQSEYDSFVKKIKEQIEYTNAQEVALGILSNMFGEFSGKVKDATEYTSDYISKTKDWKDAIASLSSEIGNMDDAQEKLSKAVKEYNENGSLSYDTVKSLLDLGADYTEYLILENGQLALNEAGIISLTEAKKEELLQDLKMAQASEISDAREQAKKDLFELHKMHLSGIETSERENEINATLDESIISITDAYGNQIAMVSLLGTALSDTTSKTETASEKIRSELKQVGSEVESLSKKYDDLRNAREESEKSMMGNVDLAHRPIVPDGEDSYETVHSMTLNGEEEGTYFLVTPILPDGTKLDENENAIWDYVDKYFGGDMASSDIFLGLYNSIEEADSAAVKLHEDQAAAYDDEAEAYLSLRSKTEEYLALQKELSEVIFDETNDKLDESQAAYETLTSAIKEYNKTGVLSVDTFQKLMSLSPEFLQMYFNQATAADNATNAIYTQAQALQIAKIQELQAAAANDVYLYSIGKYSEMSPLAQQAIGLIGSTAISTGSNLLVAAANSTTFTATVLSQLNAMRKAGGLSEINVGSLTSGMNSIISSYQGIANSIANINVSNLSNLANATNSAGSAAKNASNAYETLLNDVIKMLTQEVNDKIDALKDELSAQEKLKDAAIDALDAQLESYKKLTSARKKALEQLKDEKDYQDDLQDKQKDVTEIQSRLDELSFDTSESGMAEKLRLQEELADAQKKLDDYQYDHQVNLQEDALDDAEDAYEESVDTQKEALEDAFELVKEDYEVRIQALEDYLDKENLIRQAAIELIKGKSSEFYAKLIEWNKNYGDMSKSELLSLISSAGTAATSISNSMGGASKSVGGVGSAAKTAKGDFDDLNTSADNFFSIIKNVISFLNSNGWLLSLAGSVLGSTIGRLFSSNSSASPIETHHKGLDSGFVGNKLNGNESFVKALKGEVFVTPMQQNSFMNKTLPSLLSDSGSSITADNLISINVSGNLDSSVVPELKTTIKSSFESLAKTLASRGIVRTANNFQ